MALGLLLQLPKYKLLLGAAFGKKWEEDEVLRPLEELSVAEVRAFMEYRRAVVEERTLDPLRVRKTGHRLCGWQQRSCGGSLERAQCSAWCSQ